MSDEGPHAMDAAPAFTVGRYGSIIEWDPETGWTRNGVPFDPDPSPISQGLLDSLPLKSSESIKRSATMRRMAPVPISSIAQFEEQYGKLSDNIATADPSRWRRLLQWLRWWR